MFLCHRDSVSANIGSDVILHAAISRSNRVPHFLNLHHGLGFYQARGNFVFCLLHYIASPKDFDHRKCPSSDGRLKSKGSREDLVGGAMSTVAHGFYVRSVSSLLSSD